MILHLPAANPSAWTGPTGNNTWLLSGRVPALIDAGVGNAAHLDAIGHALAGSPLSLVLITHDHVDHASGVPALLARWPSARVRRACGDEGLRDGEQIEAGDSSLRVVHTPGHAPDHCCFLLESTGEIFSGDLVRAGGTVVIPASKGGDLAKYVESLRRIRGLGPRRLFPGHGPAIDHPAALIDVYLRHRAERDEQILSALESGCRTPADIVRVVYRGLPRGFQPAAEDTALAHLIKLRGEGRVVEEDGTWRTV
jgi:glyoxylase-like metal-dependent hydrolase (beta-lactamase superfamily II)